MPLSALASLYFFLALYFSPYYLYFCPLSLPISTTSKLLFITSISLYTPSMPLSALSLYLSPPALYPLRTLNTPLCTFYTNHNTLQDPPSQTPNPSPHPHSPSVSASVLSPPPSRTRSLGPSSKSLFFLFPLSLTLPLPPLPSRPPRSEFLNFLALLRARATRRGVTSLFLLCIFTHDAKCNCRYARARLPLHMLRHRENRTHTHLWDTGKPRATTLHPVRGGVGGGWSLLCYNM